MKNKILKFKQKKKKKVFMIFMIIGLKNLQYIYLNKQNKRLVAINRQKYIENDFVFSYENKIKILFYLDKKKKQNFKCLEISLIGTINLANNMYFN